MTQVTETKMLNAIVPWFGGKRTLAPAIVAELGEHKAYFEPFCGSCAVLFRKPVVPIETVNDLHGPLVNLAMVLASDRWGELYEQVDRMLMCQELLDEFVGGFEEDDVPSGPNWIEDHHVLLAARYLAVSWIFRNGVSGTLRVNHQMAVRWTQGGGSPGIRWRAAVDSVPAWHDRLKGVTILRRDAFEVIERIADQPGTAVYVDPPYLKSTRGKGGGSAYRHDFEEFASPLLNEGDDHARLAQALERFEHARVVVSYYDDPRLGLLYPADKWRRVDLSRHKNLASQNKRGPVAATAPEVLLVNRNRPTGMSVPQKQGGSQA